MRKFKFKALEKYINTVRTAYIETQVTEKQIPFQTGFHLNVYTPCYVFFLRVHKVYNTRLHYSHIFSFYSFYCTHKY